MLVGGVEYLVVVGVVNLVAFAELVGMSAGELCCPRPCCRKGTCDGGGRLLMSVVLGIWAREEPEQLVDLNGLGKCDRFRGCWV